MTPIRTTSSGARQHSHYADRSTAWTGVRVSATMRSAASVAQRMVTRREKRVLLAADSGGSAVAGPLLARATGMIVTPPTHAWQPSTAPP